MAFKTTSRNRQKRTVSQSMYNTNAERLDFSLPNIIISQHIYGIIIECNKCQALYEVSIEKIIEEFGQNAPFKKAFYYHKKTYECKCNKTPRHLINAYDKFNIRIIRK
ncbi:hypothetical protein DGI_3165 [Megalodesulfovibrio gigas DSM 1382 = ATCC 19364]|uniref:Uncharacterized protein n=1 Tax=Megalodesulfovibrio gigas (strain ATCC 19364 / DSM 1382 / NCIMB 9332 / VKM B-1759) TaxID=1121448 RepID=T2GFG7_MEGG1|nr:hypothetical protein DGI_3165 [Megalodesulfovibrio gigas DSM 1382 = ATCC 19364]